MCATLDCYFSIHVQMQFVGLALIDLNVCTHGRFPMYIKFSMKNYSETCIDISLLCYCHKFQSKQFRIESINILHEDKC